VSREHLAIKAARLPLKAALRTSARISHPLGAIDGATTLSERHLSFHPDVERRWRLFTCWPAILWILRAINRSSDRVAARVVHALKSAAAARI